MAACVCASAISAEMRDWQSLGGSNSGCCGDSGHTYGFHVPAAKLGTHDYSRTHEKAPPYKMNWACAGDFAHKGKAKLRARHAKVLAALMAGKYPMICEFIGQPYATRPVYYWARWNGIKTLQRYTGAGHTTWSHISWWRSRAHQRAYLWRPPPKPVAVRPDPGTICPKYPGKVLRYNPNVRNAHVKIWQAQMHARGWKITADGFFGKSTLAVVRAFQKEKRLKDDGVIGQVTWTAAWTKPVTGD